MLSMMPKAHNKSGAREEDDTSLHGAINEAEAKLHPQKLQQTIIDLKTSAVESDIREIMGDFVSATKVCCEEVYPPPRSGCTESVTLDGRPIWPSNPCTN